MFALFLCDNQSGKIEELGRTANLPFLQITEGVHQNIEVNRFRAVEIILICVGLLVLLSS
jgi:hypothetical protein